MSNPASGVTGVTWHSTEQKWQVYIRVDGKQLSLGRFNNFTEAVKARLQAERKLLPLKKRKIEREQHLTQIIKHPPNFAAPDLKT